jgi:hypothetical protein
MTPEIKYELWKNDVVQRARELYAAANAVGKKGIAGMDDYHQAHKMLWNVLEREPTFPEPKRVVRK